MAHIFDGREFAKKKEEDLKEKVSNLSVGIKPKLVSIIVGNDPASILYQGLKKKAAERIGAGVDIKVLSDSIDKEAIIEIVKSLNEDKKVHGIMIQLPLPENYPSENRDEIINAVSPEKDVDGLRVDSKFTPPTAKAVIEILKLAVSQLTVQRSQTTVCIVGASGFIGGQIVRNIKKEYNNIGIKELKLIEANSKTYNLQHTTYNSDVIISVTGVPDLIKAEMVKEGAILIDVGAPKGDIEKSAYKKALFVSPVPGGVGPVTISCLMENLVNSVSVDRDL